MPWRWSRRPAASRGSTRCCRRCPPGSRGRRQSCRSRSGRGGSACSAACHLPARQRGPGSICCSCCWGRGRASPCAGRCSTRARRLAERVAGERWAAPTALAANVLALLGIAVAQQPAPVAEPVAAVVADAVAADPELIRQPQYDAWWRAVIARYPVLASRTRAAELRRELAVVSSAAQAADLCADALLTGCGKRDVLGALAGCPVLDGPEAVHDFLLALLRRLLREGDDEFAWSTHSSMARAVLGNALGARLADSYRAWLAARAPDEIRCWVSLMVLVGDAVDRQRLAGLPETAQRLRQLSFSRGQGSRRRWRWR